MLAMTKLRSERPFPGASPRIVLTMSSPSGSIPLAPDVSADPTDEAVQAIVSRGPAGAFAVAGIASGIVMAIYAAFYVYAYLPRGVIQ